MNRRDALTALATAPMAAALTSQAQAAPTQPEHVDSRIGVAEPHEFDFVLQDEINMAHEVWDRYCCDCKDWVNAVLDPETLVPWRPLEPVMVRKTILVSRQTKRARTLSDAVLPGQCFKAICIEEEQDTQALGHISWFPKDWIRQHSPLDIKIFRT